MAEPLKLFFSPELVARLADDLARAEPTFPRAAFAQQAANGLDNLELMERGKHIAQALRDHLPAEYPNAIAILLRSLGAEHASDELEGLGLAPFFYLPHVIFVAEWGTDDFDLSFRAQHELTRRFTAEFSIRAFIEKDPERTLSQLRAWTQDPNPHVRRLVSEGTRLRLPWARRVPWLDANPTRVVELLELLKDDPAPLVRRSVANNINDLAKADPELAVRICRRWSSAASKERQALIRHALRSLMKKGHSGALTLLGTGASPQITVGALKLSAKTVPLGGELRFSFAIRSTAARAQSLVVDYVAGLVGARGQLRPKVFKLKRLNLAAGQSATFEAKLSFAPMTTRKHYPGRHELGVRVNGVTYPLGDFNVHA